MSGRAASDRPTWLESDLRRRRVVLLVEAVLLSIAVYAYLRSGIYVQAVDGLSVDNGTTARFVALMANGHPVEVWTTSQDPWLRYAPQAVLAALLPLGHVSMREAALVNSAFVSVSEAVVFPLSAYLFVRIVARRPAATTTLGLYALLRLATPRHTFGSIFITPLRIEVAGEQFAFSTYLGVAGMYSADHVYAGLAPALLGVAYLGVRRLYRSVDEGFSALWVVVTPICLAVPLVFYADAAFILDSLGGSYTQTEHQYLALAPMWTLGAILGFTASIRFGERTWAVVAGVLLGIAGSIQLGAAAYAALAVAVIGAYYRAWTLVGVTAAVSTVVAAPTLPVVFLHESAYSSGFDRVVTQSPPLVSLALVTVATLVLATYGRRLFEARDLLALAVLSGCWAGSAVIATLFWWWAEPRIVATQPFVIGTASVLATRVGAAVSADSPGQRTRDNAERGGG